MMTTRQVPQSSQTHLLYPLWRTNIKSHYLQLSSHSQCS